MNRRLVRLLPLIIASTCISFLIAISGVLSLYADDKMKHRPHSFIMYVSKVLLSTVLGVVTSCISMGIDNNLYIAIGAAAIGSFLSKKSLNIILEVILATFLQKLNSLESLLGNVSKSIEYIEEENEESTDSIDEDNEKG